jgi:hypothetical protein
MNTVLQAIATAPEELDFLELDRIIEDEYGGDKENLIMILQAIQRRYNYLPRHEPRLSF